LQFAVEDGVTDECSDSISNCLCNDWSQPVPPPASARHAFHKAPLQTIQCAQFVRQQLKGVGQRHRKDDSKKQSPSTAQWKQWPPRSGLRDHYTPRSAFRGLFGLFCHRSKIMLLYCISRRPGFSCNG
jgi:hypothetical protein